MRPTEIEMDRSIHSMADAADVTDVTDMDMTDVTDVLKPAAKDMSHHYSDLAKARKPNVMKSFYKFFAIPGVGNLAGGSYKQLLSFGSFALTSRLFFQVFPTLNSFPSTPSRLSLHIRTDGHPRRTVPAATPSPLLRLRPRRSTKGQRLLPTSSFLMRPTPPTSPRGSILRRPSNMAKLRDTRLCFPTYASSPANACTLTSLTREDPMWP